MGETNGKYPKDAMNQMIGNVTAEFQSKEGQQFMFAHPHPHSQTVSDPGHWQQPQSSYGYEYPERVAHPGLDQFGRQYNFIHNNLYEGYKPLNDFDVYQPISNENLFDNANYIYNRQSGSFNIEPEASRLLNTNHTLIENMVGNWMAPNTTGTYSPFGPSENYKPKVFQPEEPIKLEEHKFMPVDFARDKKPRMVAEVKPMRPSYSDVLTKPVPLTTKPTKTDPKDPKPKKDSKSKSKDKTPKVILNRSNTNNDIKDIPDKMKKMEKNAAKPINRKWASLDNISDQSGKVEDPKKKKEDNKGFKNKKANKTIDLSEIEDIIVKNENVFFKNGVKKVSSKSNSRHRMSEGGGGGDRPPGKRNQRGRKKENQVPFGFVGQKLKQYMKGWGKMIGVFVLWLFHLISDVCSLSLHISIDSASNSWIWLCTHWKVFTESGVSFIKNLRLFTWFWEKLKGRRKEPEEEKQNFNHTGLPYNINMPTTGDEAMKRLLACRGKDPYSILGLSLNCTDDDIKRYYKRQAFLVHPDKNQLPGAEEAFKILVHAFDMIGEPERRAAYDRGVVESAQVVQAWTELNDLLQQLQQKVETAANTIRCSSCGLRHKRVKVDRPSYAARNCTSCKIRHPAREGDIWAEARIMGFLWHYYACMEGGVYDITEWAGCQKESLKHLRSDSHHVQYRIALGKQNNQPKRSNASPRAERPDLENILNSFYGQGDGASGTRRRSKKANK